MVETFKTVSGSVDLQGTIPTLKIKHVLKCFARSAPKAGVENQTIPFSGLSLSKKCIYRDRVTNIYVERAADT